MGIRSTEILSVTWNGLAWISRRPRCYLHWFRRHWILQYLSNGYGLFPTSTILWYKKQETLAVKWKSLCSTGTPFSLLPRRISVLNHLMRYCSFVPQPRVLLYYTAPTFVVWHGQSNARLDEPIAWYTPWVSHTTSFNYCLDIIMIWLHHQFSLYSLR